MHRSALPGVPARVLAAGAGGDTPNLGILVRTAADRLPPERISVVNADSTTHTVTADRGNAFDVSVAGGGTTTMGAPATAGSYPLHCRIHPFMKGILIVR